MRRPVFSRLPLLAVVGAGALLCASAAACSEDGVTPNCPSVRLYDVRTIGTAGGAGAAEEAEAVEEERQAAVDAGCQTDIYVATPGSED